MLDKLTICDPLKPNVNPRWPALLDTLAPVAVVMCHIALVFLPLSILAFDLNGFLPL